MRDDWTLEPELFTDFLRLAFRALALTHLERIDEAEKSYHTALKLAPGHAFALPGLKRLYIKYGRWDDLGRLLEISVQTAYDEYVEEWRYAVEQCALPIRTHRRTLTPQGRPREGLGGNAGGH